ncbi:hypothetical protein [Corynebacterium sp. CCM 9204]|uniref:hypothetical protein n=1 Tax=Corynebacterium sp. CCM 9204 TaxID=3057616 RepID=UPI00352468E3
MTSDLACPSGWGWKGDCRAQALPPGVPVRVARSSEDGVTIEQIAAGTKTTSAA